MGRVTRPSQPALPLFVSAASYGRGLDVSQTANISVQPPSSTTWVSLLVAYMPVVLPFDYPVSRVSWLNGATITGSNVDVGIYTADGVRLYRTGSVAMAGAALPQYVTPGTPFVLSAGRYYFAWTCDGTTNRAQAHAGSAAAGSMWGLLEETTGALGLPATMANAVRWTRAWGYNVVAVSRTTTGF